LTELKATHEERELPEIAWLKERRVTGLTTVHNNGKYGIMDDDGNMRVPFAFNFIKLIDEDTAFAGIETESVMGTMIYYGVIRIPEYVSPEVKEARKQQEQEFVESYLLDTIPELERAQVILEEYSIAIILTVKEGKTLSHKQIYGIYSLVFSPFIYELYTVTGLSGETVSITDENGLPLLSEEILLKYMQADARGEIYWFD